jgi:hypothetical protein
MSQSLSYLKARFFMKELIYIPFNTNLYFWPLRATPKGLTIFGIPSLSKYMIMCAVPVTTRFWTALIENGRSDIHKATDGS